MTATDDRPGEGAAMYEMTDRDKGALAALALLVRSDEAHEGEEDWRTTADDIASAIGREGLAATIRLQMDAETDYFADSEDDLNEMYGPFPAPLAAIAAEAPHTTWKRP